MLIGLGGGAASSMDTGSTRRTSILIRCSAAIAEMERRAQEVIDCCWQMERRGEPNPILSIHDVGAGGLSNALPELVHGSGRGGMIQFARYPLRRAGDVTDADLEQRGTRAVCACNQTGIDGIIPARFASVNAARSRW